MAYVLAHKIGFGVQQNDKLWFLSLPIACAACERTELLKTKIGVTQMEVIYELCVSYCFF